MVSTVAIDDTGPIPIVSGATPATAHEASRTSGVSPSAEALSAVVTTHIAAPSFCPEALPAVTVASGSVRPIMGRRRPRASTEVSARAAKTPDCWAATAR